MKVPYSWLQELIAELPPVAELPELCDGLGLACETVHRYGGAAPGTVAVRLDALERVGGSDHLLMAKAFDGRHSHTVVTGAPNARVGMVTAFAAPNVRLQVSADDNGAGVVVESRLMAGVRSDGVLLSPRELGVHDFAGGLIELPDDLELGTDLSLAWPGDDVLELELTPNRADAFSILGVARDLAAKLGVAYRHPADGADMGDSSVDDGLLVRIEDRDGCPGLTLRRIDGVSVGPSPLWLQRRLASIGLRPRNNVVDVTNFVTFELGQPSHAYDLGSIVHGELAVRAARDGERLTTLLGDEVELDPADLVIAAPRAAGSPAIGLAGVVGGQQGSVGEGTASVALEVAHFDPVRIRRTAKRHGLSTDAHYRFERGVDPNLPPLASARAAELIATLSGGTVHPGVTLSWEPTRRPPVDFRPERVHFIMDFEVPLPDQRRYLQALGCTVDEVGADDPAIERGVRWRVTPPSWRFDLAIEEDIVEEVARLHGYEHVGETVPNMRFVPPRADPTHRALRNEIAGLGFQEAIGYVFTSDKELERSAAPPAQVKLSDPQGIERSVLRTALYPGLLAAASHNRALTSLALFEVGRVFLDDEHERVSLLARGPWEEPGWQPGRPLDFFLLKGLLEQLAARRNVELVTLPAEVPHLHPGVSAKVLWNGREVGSAGRLHPEVAARYGLGDTYLAELTLPLESLSVRYREVPRQPHAERDVSVIAPVEVDFLELRGIVAAAAGPLLESLEPFDLYRGDPIPEGQQSLALRLRFRHGGRALRDDEVDTHMQNVIGSLRERGYDIRDR